MRKSLVAVLAVALVLAGGLVALLGPRHCPVNRAAFGRIGEGMTRGDVHAMLGGPPGDYRTGPSSGPWPDSFTSPAHGVTEVWEGDEGAVTVYYDSVDATVFLTRFKDAVPLTPTPVELARWRLGRLKEALLP
jgi:hypothetical protein